MCYLRNLCWFIPSTLVSFCMFLLSIWSVVWFLGFIYMDECFACMYTCSPTVCLAPREVRRGFRSPGTEVSMELLGTRHLNYLSSPFFCLACVSLSIYLSNYLSIYLSIYLSMWQMKVLLLAWSGRSILVSTLCVESQAMESPRTRVKYDGATPSYNLSWLKMPLAQPIWDHPDDL